MSEKDHDLLVRLDENVRNWSKTITEKLGDHTSSLNDHETRIRTLETVKDQAQGSQLEWGKILAAVAAIGGLIGAVYWINH